MDGGERENLRGCGRMEGGGRGSAVQAGAEREQEIVCVAE